MILRSFDDVQRELDRIEAALRTPVLIPEYASPSDLPLASKYRRGLVLVTSINMVAVSNGTNWLRLDTGASI